MSNKPEIDFSDVEPRLLKENYIIGLNFPGKGVVFFKVSAKEVIPYIYDEIDELGANEFRNYDRFGIAANNITNAFEVKHENVLYQIFYGITPSAVRLYPSYPSEVPRGNLEIKNVFARGLFGFKDGFMSPFSKPNPISELFVPYNTQIGWAVHNPLNDNAVPQINFLIGKYNIDLICDCNLIEKVLSGKKEARIATIGGVSSGEVYKYDTVQIWGIQPIPLDASAEEICAITGGVKSVQYRGKGV